MTKEQLKAANDLEKKITEVSFILNELRMENFQIRLIDLGDDGSFLIRNDFIVEKMIEAGIWAAKTVMEAAKNDLEKL
jgi:uncharacterized protein with ACT and thioredoxin-like domain